MPRSDLQTQFATKTTEAVTEYGNAAMAAYAHGWADLIKHWTAAFESMMPEDPNRPKSWFKHPDHQPASAAFPATANLWPMTPDWSAMMWPYAAFSAVQAAPTMCAPQQMNPANWMAPMATAWPAVWPMNMFGSSAYVWPMAFSMMAAGMPEAVAVPTAKGNAAAMDAVDSANKLADTAFSSYQSASGFASAQVRTTPASKNKTKNTAPADFTAFMWPWVA
jgi:hypothetical protein